MDENQTKTEENKMSLIEEAKAATEELKKANAEKKALLDREEKLKAELILAGRSEAGINPEKPKEESDKDYAKRLISKPYGDAKVDTPE